MAFYTGIRCGLAVAIGLATGVQAATTTDLPMININTLQLAQVHILNGNGRTWVDTQGNQLAYRPIANRAALVVVDVDLKGGSNPRLQGLIPNQNLGFVSLTKNVNAFTTAPYTSSNITATPTTWYARIPAEWMQKGLRLRVVADNVQQSTLKTITPSAPIDFELYTLPFYLFGATDNTLAFDQVKAPLLAAQQEAWAKWPISTLKAKNHAIARIDWPYVIVSPRNGQAAYQVNTPSEKKDGFAIMSAALTVLGQIRQANGDGGTANQYYAPLVQADPTGKFVGTGGGLGGGHVGTGDHVYKGIFIHEQGHAFGLPHAGESYDAQSGYPYAGGSLKGSARGYDLKNWVFLNNIVQPSASSYNNCQNHTYNNGTPRQLDSLGRCIKQDPMQSGSGDQEAGYLYTHFSDYNVAKMQRYFEGLTTINASGQKSYSGGRIFNNPAMPKGYARWDSVDQAWVPFDPSSDGNKGLYGAEQNYPINKNVLVYTIVLSVSKAGTAGATQIYPIIRPHNGNLLKTFDPTNAQDRVDMTPNTSKYPWYCRNSGCDYTLKLTYADGSIKYTALQGGFRPWFGQDSDFSAAVQNPTDGSSFKVWAINVPAQAVLQKVELLDTPKSWLGIDVAAPVLATRTR